MMMKLARCCGGVQRASGADADGIAAAIYLENNDGKDEDEDVDAGGVLRASGADADGIEKKDRKDDDKGNDDEGGCSADGRGGKPGAVTKIGTEF
jgi:hypothetical protein